MKDARAAMAPPEAGPAATRAVSPAPTRAVSPAPTRALSLAAPTRVLGPAPARALSPAPTRPTPRAERSRYIVTDVFVDADPITEFLRHAATKVYDRGNSTDEKSALRSFQAKSRAGATITALVHAETKKYPIRGFRVLVDPAFARVMVDEYRKCPDRFDDLIADIMKSYPTVEALLSQACQEELAALADLIMLDNHRVPRPLELSI